MYSIYILFLSAGLLVKGSAQNIQNEEEVDSQTHSLPRIAHWETDIECQLEWQSDACVHDKHH